MRRSALVFLGPLTLVLLVGFALWSMQREGDITEETATHGEPAPALTPLVPSGGEDTATVTQEPEPTPEVEATVEEVADEASSTDEPVLVGEDVEHDGPADPQDAPLPPRDEDQAAEFEAYEQAAVAFLEAYARPESGVSDEQWWAAVQGLLAEPAQADYAGVNPQEVPFTAVTGDPQMVPVEAPAHVLRLVQVPTDAGDYLVSLQTDADGITVTRITPAGQGELP